jgi:hypothetical protein
MLAKSFQANIKVWSHARKYWARVDWPESDEHTGLLRHFIRHCSQIFKSQAPEANPIKNLQ